MDFNVINDTTQTAYLQLGVGTYDVNYGTVTVNGAVGSDASVIATIAAGATVTGVDINEAISAKLLLSLGTTLVSSNPSFTNPGVPDYDTRWDKVELTLLQPTADASSALNLSANDFFGLDLQVQTFTSAAATVPNQTLGWNIDAAQEMQSLAAISGFDTSYAVMTGSDGIPVTTPHGTIDALRVVSPNSVAASGSANPYPSFDAYIEHIQNAGIVTTVSDMYDGIPGATLAPFMGQGYTFLASINPATGTVLPGTGNGDLVMVGTASLIAGTQTIDIPAGSLAAGIYSANPNFTVNGTADTIGNNDVYAAAVAEILGGFDSGFVGSNESNPNTPGTTYADSTTGQWYNPKPGGSTAFAAAQPGNPTYYDNYAAAVVQNSSAYGSAFTDLIGGPQAEINPSTNPALGTPIDHVNITILPDSIPCFATGTPIMTEAGEVPVERLAVGARVPTRFSGALGDVVWIGRRVVDCGRHPHPESVWPVRVRRGAFGRKVPHCDVLLSRDHALLVDDV
ncbi:MAG: Hint domain-containing protein, partial [Acetobacteraceae bacterium]